MSKKQDYDGDLLVNVNGSETHLTSAYNLIATNGLSLNNIPTGITNGSYSSTIGAAIGAISNSLLGKIVCSKTNTDISVKVSNNFVTFVPTATATAFFSFTGQVPLGYRPTTSVLLPMANLSLLQSDTQSGPGTNVTILPAYATLDTNGTILVNILSLTTGLPSTFTTGKFYSFTEFEFLFPSV